MITNTIMIGLPLFQRPIQANLLDKTVVDIFDELLTEVMAKAKLHPSEEVGREPTVPFGNSKIYDIVNSYHGFCKLCEQHFYSRSVSNDINSFFQMHLNTPYHRQLRSVRLCPDDVPIFSWERPLRTARCNICELPALEAFILSTKFFVTRLLQQHVCVWPPDQRETNEKFVRKVNLLKKYCGLSEFRKKFIRTINKRCVCVLCGVWLPWSGEEARCHLQSDTHFQKFCIFIWDYFKFAPKDVLNGFNLEAVTRWLITHEPPMYTQFVDSNDLATCLVESKTIGGPYPEDKMNASFSSKLMETLLRDVDSDFMHVNMCLLCDTQLTPGHFSSALHWAKAAVVSKASFTPKNYQLFLEKRKNRLLPFTAIISIYKRLKKEILKGSGLLAEEKEANPTESSQPHPAPLPSDADEVQQSNYFQSLLVNKLTLVKEMITSNGPEIFCHVCDQHMRESRRVSHLQSGHHRMQLEKWEELRESSLDKSYFDPFKLVQDVIVCLLCAAVIHGNNFFSHLKGNAHARQLKLYCGLNMGIPISSVFKFREDSSCFCKFCNYLLTKKERDLVPLKSILKKVQEHWPCREAQEWGKDLARWKGAGEQGGIENSSSTPEVELERVEKAVKGVVDAFESAIEKSVQEKTLLLLKCLSICDCKKSSKCSCSATGSSKDGAAEHSKSPKKEAKAQAVEISDNSAKAFDQEEAEVILLKGVPKKKRKLEFIYETLESFGKIRFVQFEKKVVVVGFVERGVAAAAAKEAGALLQEPKVNVVVTGRRIGDGAKGAENELLSLSKEMMDLLTEPQKLMDFLLQLTNEAVSATSSPTELDREFKVCNLIVHAAAEYFPRCRCYPFGSRLTGLTLNNSDLDVFLDCGDMYEGFRKTTATSEKNLVRTVGKALRKRKEVRDLIVVDSARVPIVSFLHLPTGLHCDISFKSGLSIQNSLLIKFLVSLDWRVKPLILFLKYWAKQNGLHGPPYFSSYALSMLVINYLEQMENPLLPTIESLQSSYVGRRITIGGWDCSVNANKEALPKLNNKDPIPKLLAGFFQFYANFDFSKNVVFPLTGKPLPRTAFSDEGKSLLPMSFKRHIINVLTPLESLVSNKFPICVFDPFDLSHVLTKSFTPHGLLQFQYLCTMSTELLNKGMAEQNI